MSMSYIAKKECGCTVGAIVDAPEQRKEVAKQVRDWIRCGFVVERVVSDSVPDEWEVCQHEEGFVQASLFDLAEAE